MISINFKDLDVVVTVDTTQEAVELLHKLKNESLVEIESEIPDLSEPIDTRRRGSRGSRGSRGRSGFEIANAKRKAWARKVRSIQEANGCSWKQAMDIAKSV